MYIRIGQIVNTHGHKGEVKVYPLTSDPNRFYGLTHAYIAQEGTYHKFQVTGARLHKGLAILTLAEVPDMNSAEKLKGSYLELPEQELKPLPPDQFYHFQLLGLSVYEGNTFLGKISDILQTGSNDVYVIKNEGQKDILLPALKSVVQKIDLEAGTMEVVLPLGLLD